MSQNSFKIKSVISVFCYTIQDERFLTVMIMLAQRCHPAGRLKAHLELDFDTWLGGPKVVLLRLLRMTRGTWSVVICGDHANNQRIVGVI